MANVKVQPLDNGPLLVKGAIDLVDGVGKKSRRKRKAICVVVVYLVMHHSVMDHIKGNSIVPFVQSRSVTMGWQSAFT